MYLIYILVLKPKSSNISLHPRMIYFLHDLVPLHSPGKEMPKRIVLDELNVSLPTQFTINNVSQ